MRGVENVNTACGEGGEDLVDTRMPQNSHYTSFPNCDPPFFFQVFAVQEYQPAFLALRCSSTGEDLGIVRGEDKICFRVEVVKIFSDSKGISN